VVQHADLVVDTRNVIASAPDDGAKIVRLGAPLPVI